MTAFLTEPAPPYGEAVPVAPGVRRVVAPNPGPMTYHGTNTYLIDGAEGTTVLDPGPEDAGHTASVLRAANRVARILLTHTHPDHVGGLPALRAATGAPVAAWHAPAAALDLDVLLHDGTVVAGLSALHTPGHAADHLCFARPDGVLFSGDHVMSWSSTVVIPPNGTMADYMRSLDRLLARPADTLFLPGHGPPLPDPLPFVRALREHRLGREASILAALEAGPATTAAITARVYDVAPPLLRAAERNVLAHLVKLEGDGRAARDGDGWRATPSASVVR